MDIAKDATGRVCMAAHVAGIPLVCVRLDTRAPRVIGVVVQHTGASIARRTGPRVGSNRAQDTGRVRLAECVRARTGGLARRVMYRIRSVVSPDAAAEVNAMDLPVACATVVTLDSDVNGMRPVAP